MGKGGENRQYTVSVWGQGEIMTMKKGRLKEIEKIGKGNTVL